MTENPHRQGPSVTKADVRKARKIATGPLLGAYAESAAPAAEATAPARIAPIGNFARMRERLHQTLNESP